jgi:hypothetical protein
MKGAFIRREVITITGFRLLWIGFGVALAPAAFGQGSDAPAEGEKSAEAMPSLTELKHYGGDLMSRSTLIGDWGGAHDDLAADGITIDIDITQIMQSNTHGGADTNNGIRYTGSADYTVISDTARMRLWPRFACR